MLIILVFLHLLLLINTTFTLWPEMVVYPYLINNGFLLYRDIINPYPPLFPKLLALFSSFFGYVPRTFEIMTWLIIVLIDLTIFFISKKIFNKNSHALFSTLFFVVFSMPFGINGLWFDLIQTPFIIFSIYYLLNFIKKSGRKYLLLSLLFSAIAFSIKQQATWFIIFQFLAVLIYSHKKPFIEMAKNFIFFSIFIVAWLIQILIFLKPDQFSDFFFWTFYFPFLGASNEGYLSLPTAKNLIIIAALLLFFLPSFRKVESRFILLGSLSLFPFAYPRFDYFHLIPAVSLLSLIFVQNLIFLKKEKTTPRTFLMTTLIFLVLFASKYIYRNFHGQIRFFEPEIITAGNIVHEMTQPKETIFIQNAPDQILPLSNTLPVKPWVDDFPWYLEQHNLQSRVVQGITNQKPKFIISEPFKNGHEFGLGSYRPELISDFIDVNYESSVKISDQLILKIHK